MQQIIPLAREKINNTKREILKDLTPDIKPKKVNILSMGIETYKKENK